MLKYFISLLFVNFLFIAPGTIQASEAMDAFNKKDYNEAYRLWSRDPDKTESQYGIGRILLEGLGGDPNPTKGLNLLVSSANKKYMRSIRYLAKYYEKQRNYSAAIKYLKKTGNPKSNLKLQTKIIKLTKNLRLKKPVWESKLYCSEATIYLKAGGDSLEEKNLMEKCAVSNNKSNFTKDEAIKSLVKVYTSSPNNEIFNLINTNTISQESVNLLVKSYTENPSKPAFNLIKKYAPTLSIESKTLLIDSFSVKPNDSTFTLIGSLVLEPKSKNFAPEVVENFFWGKQKERKEPIFLNTLKSYNLQMKVCKSLPGKTESEKNKANSYCLLSALIENDTKIIEQIAKSFYDGTNGGKIDTIKGNYLKNIAGLSADENTDQLQLNAYMLTNNWREHLTTLEKLIGKILIKQDILEKHLTFQLDKLVLYKQSGYAKNHGVQLANVLIKIRTTPRDIRIKAFKILPMLPDANKFKYPTADVKLPMLINELEKVAYKLETPSADITKPSTTARSRSESSLDIIKNDPGYFATKNPKPIGKYTVGYEKLKIECDSAGMYDSCARAAKIIMSDAPPKEYKNIKKKERKNIGIELLKKGANAESPKSMIMLYDIYSKDLDSNSKAKANEYLAILVSNENPAGLLRENLKEIPTSFVSGLITGIGLIIGDRKHKQACKGIEILVRGKKLDLNDQIKAEEALENEVCRKKS